MMMLYMLMGNLIYSDDSVIHVDDYILVLG